MKHISNKESPTLAIAIYCLASILMTVTNKLVLGSYQFTMTFLVLAIQNAATVLLLVISSNLSLLSYRRLNTKDAVTWSPIAFALVAMILTGAKTLRYMSIPLFTIYKNVTIILIAVGERLWFNGHPITKLIAISFGLVVLSSIVAGWTDIMSAKGGLKDPNALFAAYFWMVLNCFTTASFSLCLRAKIKQVNFKDHDTVYYNNLLSVPILLLGSLMFEMQAGSDMWERFVSPGDESSQLPGLVVALLLSSVCAFGISFGTSMCVRLTSSTTYSFVGALNKLPISISGMLFFNDPVTVGSVSGVVIACAGGLLYSHAKNEQMKELAMLPTTITEMRDRKMGSAEPLMLQVEDDTSEGSNKKI
ncbi:UDP-galactose transporter [Rhizoclosmatium globosum]|uniref:GDP-mannose transporter n=1 Tax=Rhizoclosmatium globosum TaxID=329046 RepID=A0A1Y2C1A3_9FUNG|nr:UDP-galactose transporter [Rhizoclosmatium globosum]|eukprot:ORY40657.1 UDP-galactose transporter [Rhizoclosmatium globosum]